MYFYRVVSGAFFMSLTVSYEGGLAAGKCGRLLRTNSGRSSWPSRLSVVCMWGILSGMRYAGRGEVMMSVQEGL